jgi:hypothetical protein
MKLQSRFVALAVLLSSIFASTAAAHAQGAIYLNPVAIRVSTVTDNGTYSFLGPNTTSRMFYGFTLGGFYDVKTQFKKVEIGVDIRDTLVHGNDASINSFTLGPRIAFAPVSNRLHPYIEPFVAAGGTHAPHTALHITKLQYGAYAGADLDLNRHFTFRAVEIGYSSLTTASDGTIGESATVPSAKLFSITTGFTIRLP